MTDTAEQLKTLQDRTQDSLDRRLPAAGTHPASLHAAMRYSVTNGGKRVRPLLVYATGQALGLELTTLDGPACAVELIHAYSLIHDDLPAMDDDDLRRGQPTCHKAFDEATAILAGDALQALAFYILAHDTHMTGDAHARLRMIQTLAQAAGSRGMAGGQAIDLEAVGRSLDITELEAMHIRKTGALIRASVRLGAIGATDVDSHLLDKLDHYANCIGLAFQIRDDILDIEGDTQTLGKTQGADQALNKPTYPSILGLDAAKAQARELHAEALGALQALGPQAALLRHIADYIVTRLH